MRTAVERDEPVLAVPLVFEDDPVARLRDVIVAAVRGDDRGDRPVVEDAPDRAAIVPPCARERCGPVGRHPRRLPFLCISCQRRYPSLGWIDNQRRAAGLLLAPLKPGPPQNRGSGGGN